MTVLYFAGLKDLMGRAEQQVELPETAGTIDALLDELVRRTPDLAARRASLRVAKNETFADGSEPVADGDVIALIPPVAGG